MKTKTENKNLKARNTKKMVKGIPLLAILVVAGMLASGALLTIFSMYTGTQSGDIELNGKTPPLKIDDEYIFGQTKTVAMDLTTLSNGDILTFPHTISSELGHWDITINTSDIMFADPLDPFYGFEMNPSRTTFYVLEGTTETVDFEYSLHEDFMLTSEPLNYNVDIIIGEHTPLPPDAVNDVITEGQWLANEKKIYVLTNDIDIYGEGLTITSISDVNTDRWCIVPTIGGTFPNQYIQGGDISGTPATFKYTVTNTYGLTDTCTVSLTQD